MRGAVLEAALLVAAGLVAVEGLLCRAGHTWWSPEKDSCLDCTRCDSERDGLIVLRPCAVHQDTVCAPLSDLLLDWSWLQKTHNGRRHAKHRKEGVDTTRRLIIWKFPSAQPDNDDDDDDGDQKQRDDEAEMTTPPASESRTQKALDSLQSYPEYDSDLEVQFDSEPFLSDDGQSEFVWDWQTIVLFLASFFCLLFLIVAIFYSLYYARQWRIFKENLETDVEGLSTKISLMLATAEANNFSDPSAPSGPDSQYSNIRCAYLEQLLGYNYLNTMEPSMSSGPDAQQSSTKSYIDRANVAVHLTYATANLALPFHKKTKERKAQMDERIAKDNAILLKEVEEMRITIVLGGRISEKTYGPNSVLGYSAGYIIETESCSRARIQNEAKHSISNSYWDTLRIDASPCKARMNSRISDFVEEQGLSASNDRTNGSKDDALWVMGIDANVNKQILDNIIVPVIKNPVFEDNTATVVRKMMETLTTEKKGDLNILADMNTEYVYASMLIVEGPLGKNILEKYTNGDLGIYYLDYHTEPWAEEDETPSSYRTKEFEVKLIHFAEYQLNAGQIKTIVNTSGNAKDSFFKRLEDGILEKYKNIGYSYHLKLCLKIGASNEGYLEACAKSHNAEMHSMNGNTEMSLHAEGTRVDAITHFGTVFQKDVVLRSMFDPSSTEILLFGESVTPSYVEKIATGFNQKVLETPCVVHQVYRLISPDDIIVDRMKGSQARYCGRKGNTIITKDDTLIKEEVANNTSLRGFRYETLPIQMNDLGVPLPARRYVYKLGPIGMRYKEIETDPYYGPLRNRFNEVWDELRDDLPLITHTDHRSFNKLRNVIDDIRSCRKSISGGHLVEFEDPLQEEANRMKNNTLWFGIRETSIRKRSGTGAKTFASELKLAKNNPNIKYSQINLNHPNWKYICDQPCDIRSILLKVKLYENMRKQGAVFPTGVEWSVPLRIAPISEVVALDLIDNWKYEYIVVSTNALCAIMETGGTIQVITLNEDLRTWVLHSSDTVVIVLNDSVMGTDLLWSVQLMAMLPYPLCWIIEWYITNTDLGPQNLALAQMLRTEGLVTMASDVQNIVFVSDTHNNSNYMKFNGIHLYVEPHIPKGGFRARDAAPLIASAIDATMINNNVPLTTIIAPWIMERTSVCVDWVEIDTMAVVATVRWVPQPEVVKNDEGILKSYWIPRNFINERAYQGLPDIQQQVNPNQFFHDLAVNSIDMVFAPRAMSNDIPGFMVGRWTLGAEILTGLRIRKYTEKSLGFENIAREVRADTNPLETIIRATVLRRALEEFKKGLGIQDEIVAPLVIPHVRNFWDKLVYGVGNEKSCVANLFEFANAILITSPAVNISWEINNVRQIIPSYTGIRTTVGVWTTLETTGVPIDIFKNTHYELYQPATYNWQQNSYTQMIDDADWPLIDRTLTRSNLLITHPMVAYKSWPGNERSVRFSFRLGTKEFHNLSRSNGWFRELRNLQKQTMHGWGARVMVQDWETSSTKTIVLQQDLVRPLLDGMMTADTITIDLHSL